ncbi:Fc.00g034130.m01.CDS01 [Cosmosporella sp. VM-42]
MSIRNAASMMLLLVALFFTLFAQAHFTRRNPSPYITSIENVQFIPESGSLDHSLPLSVAFNLQGERQRIKLDLVPSHDIIAGLKSVHYLGPNGRVTNVQPLRRENHLVYKGVSLLQSYEGYSWENVGWARVTVRSDVGKSLLEGAFSINGENHHVQLDSNYRKTQLPNEPLLMDLETPYMVVWRDSGSPESMRGTASLRRETYSEPACGSRHLKLEDSPLRRNTDSQSSRWTEPHSSITNLNRRQNGFYPFDPTDAIGSTDGCPSTRRVARVGVVADCTYTADFDSEDEVRSNIISQINAASQVFEDSFNISLALQNLTISDSACPPSAPASSRWNLPCTSNTDIEGRLDLFSEWRGGLQDNNALWTLLTTCSTGSTVGIAWIGSLCDQGAQSSQGRTIASANVVVRTAAEWQVMAHEFGHNFGAIHDCTDATCADGSLTQRLCCPLSDTTCDADGQYMMNPSAGASITGFSPCSIGMVCTGIGRDWVNTDCLADGNDVTRITDSQCGNGIVEPGEDCDCGNEESCRDDPCCDRSVCRYSENAVCDPSSDSCCTSQCGFASSGEVCSESTGTCDPTGVCNGSSATCERDVQALDGASCGNGRSCDNGVCERNSDDNPDDDGSSRSWADENRTVIIAVVSSVGGIVLLGIIACVILSCRRRQKTTGTAVVSQVQQQLPYRLSDGTFATYRATSARYA